MSNSKPTQIETVNITEDSDTEITKKTNMLLSTSMRENRGSIYQTQNKENRKPNEQVYQIQNHENLANSPPENLANSPSK